MKRTYSFDGLADAMRLGKVIYLEGLEGTIQSMQREDGSGNCWNVTMNCWNGLRTVFVRTT